MINGKASDFIEKMLGGEEIIFIFDGKKWFSQGYLDGNTHVSEIVQWEPTVRDEIIWRCTSEKSLRECVNDFECAKIFNGQTFWEAETLIKWVDE